MNTTHPVRPELVEGFTSSMELNNKSTMQAISDWVHANMNESFDLVLFGKVFGDKYGEAPQTIVGVLFESDEVNLLFKSNECLRVSAPSEVQIFEAGLIIGIANRVSFSCIPYGILQDEEKRRERIYECASMKNIIPVQLVRSV